MLLNEFTKIFWRELFSFSLSVYVFIHPYVYSYPSTHMITSK